jgi:phage N-6-adenine-methyltransferase
MAKFLFGKKADDVETPDDLYKMLDKKFHFDHDPCPLFGKDDPKVPNALHSSWGKSNFVNPPYSNIKPFLKKAIREKKKGKTSVFLIPARTETTYWHKYVFGKAREIRFIKGRVRFKGFKNPSPFPVAVVIYKP